MNRPKTTIETNNELEQYEMYSVEPLCDHEWSCEAHAKWATEDSNAWHYATEEQQ